MNWDKTNLAILYFIALVIACFILFACNSYAQLTKADIKEVLILQGSQAPEYESIVLYRKYLEQQDNTLTLISGIIGSAVSGVALGSHESFTFGYKESGWLPDFLEDWYNYRPNTDAVFGKTLTWQKVWRDVDYASDRYAYNKWKLLYRAEDFFSWQTLLAYITHWTVKNTFTTLIRDKFKHNEFFYSFEGSLVIP